YRASKAPQSLFNGHLTSSNSDVRAGDNAKRHAQRWTGFPNWWAEVFGAVSLGSRDEADAFAGAPTRPPTPVPPNRTTASIPDIADAGQEFLMERVNRRNSQR